MLNALINMPDSAKAAIDHPVHAMVAGAAPPAKVIGAVEEMGIRVTHVYGLTEVYGPVTVCAWHGEWDDLPLERRAAIKSRQGVRYPTLEGVMVADPKTLEPVPRDGQSIGEIFMRGNTVMKGYLKNPSATEEAFAGGWFHTGDLAVCHPDGYIEIRDRLKDIIISGGENISTIELEGVLYRHPAVLEAAAVARPDEKWGNALCVHYPEERSSGARRERDRRVLSRTPGRVQDSAYRGVLGTAEDLHRQDPEIRAARVGRRPLSAASRIARAAAVPRRP